MSGTSSQAQSHSKGALAEMVRPLDGAEIARLQVLVDAGVPFALLEPTATGLAKAILDAVGPVRALLRSNAVHDYEDQQQGQDHKKVLPAYFLYGDHARKTKASLYRPITKNGDPRIWFSGLADYAHASSVLAVIPLGQALYVLNISAIDPHLAAVTYPRAELARILSHWSLESSQTARELIDRIRALAAAGPLRAIKNGPTAVGMTLEAALGIPPNADKAPDYKGIELKAGRLPKLAARANRRTLFAQVPDWSQSACASSAEILQKYGYQRAGAWRLYCTVSAGGPNSQGLQFKVDLESDKLLEISMVHGPVAVWDGAKLRGRLLEKHAETFWVSVDSKWIDGHEYFFLRHVIHTRRPADSAFMTLLSQGLVTMDHLIKQSAGRVTEKGPLFKIERNGLGLLFPSSNRYDL